MINLLLTIFGFNFWIHLADVLNSSIYIYTLPTKLTVTESPLNVGIAYRKNQSCRKRKPFSTTKTSSKPNWSLIDLWFGCGFPKNASCSSWSFFFFGNYRDPWNNALWSLLPHPMYSKLKLPDSNILQDTGCPVAMFEVRLYQCDTILWFGKELTLVLSSA